MKNPTIGKNVYIAEGAVVRGDVTIGDESSVWFNAVIRADREPVVIGRGTNIQDNSVVHVETGAGVVIGNHVTVGHNAVVHGCTIGDNSLIGMNAVIMNNAVIGKNCIVGACALVTQNAVIPDGSLVMGCPAAVTRTLTPEEIAEKRKKKAPAYRLMVPDEAITFTDGCMGTHTENLLRDCGDFYLRRADGVFAYQLAVVADDAAGGVTQVVRGRDLLDSTPRQLYLYELLGAVAPSFYHVPLLLASDGRRLSKRERDLDLGALRLRYTPERLLGYLAGLCGLIPAGETASARELAACFRWENVRQTDVILTEIPGLP